MTEEEIIQIWNSIPPQGDPTGKKFAVRFAQEIYQLGYRDGKFDSNANDNIPVDSW